MIAKEGQLFELEGNKYYFKNQNGKTSIYTDYNDKVMDFSYGEIKNSITDLVKESYGDYILAEILTENNIDFTVNYIYYDRIDKMFYDDFPGFKSFDNPCKKVILKQGGFLDCNEFFKGEEDIKKPEEEKKGGDSEIVGEWGYEYYIEEKILGNEALLSKKYDLELFDLNFIFYLGVGFVGLLFLLKFGLFKIIRNIF